MTQVSPNFKRQEFACKCGCGFDVADIQLIKALEDVRKQFNGNAVTITSPCRCPAHNIKVGGSTKSQHILGKAVDFKIANIHADDVADYLENRYQNTYGIGRYDGRTHLDVREKKARWDKRK